ncbi:hypothetical protein NOCA2170074 [metagenome]|uniref:AMP-dependent synthetase/ligase domain-containing protein n=1 Tax=metagenome TaxID=256318 RepID=A0A2P2C1A2_9ZZZZ
MSFLRLGDLPHDRPAEAVTALGRWLAGDDPEPLLIETSGSTGDPKRVVLRREAVLASATAAVERLGGPGRWVLALPAAYVAGVQVIVRSLLSRSWGSRRARPPSRRGRSTPRSWPPSCIACWRPTPTRCAASTPSCSVAAPSTPSCGVAPRRPAPGSWRRTAPARRPGGACTTGYRSTAWRCGSTRTGGSAWAARCCSTAMRGTRS